MIVKDLINNRKFASSRFKYCKRYLKRGLYYFDFRQYEYRKISYEINIRNIFYIFFNADNNVGGVYKIRLYSKFNPIKTVISFNDDLIYSIYSSKELYENAKNNFMMYRKKVNFAYSEFVSFDDKLNSMSFKKNNGKIYEDKKHCLKVIEKIIENQSNQNQSIKETENISQLLQHGDIHNANIIWTSKDDFVFIDLDDVGFYYPLIDLFYYMDMNKFSMDDVFRVMEKYRDLINSICKKTNIDTNSNYVDALFKGYADYLKNRQHILKTSFLNELDEIDFPKSYKTFHNIVNNRNNVLE